MKATGIIKLLGLELSSHSVKYLENISTLSVRASYFPGGIKDAFTTLESKLPSLKGRKFYGALIEEKEGIVYRACVVASESSEFNKLGLDNYIIPGGKYATTLIKNWNRNVDRIGDFFKIMSKDFEEDFSRPKVEFYRSSRELVLMLPVKQ